MSIIDNWDKQQVQTIIGTLNKGLLTSITGEIIPCVTYRNIKKEFPATFGVFNLRYDNYFNLWEIFEGVKLGDEILENISDQALPENQ